MSQFKHESKAPPTAWVKTGISAVVSAEGASGHVTLYFDNDNGDTYSKDIAVKDLPQDQQACFTTLATLMGGKVEAEGYERDPHTRRKAEKEQAEADAKAAKDAEKAEPAPVVSEVG